MKSILFSGLLILAIPIWSRSFVPPLSTPWDLCGAKKPGPYLTSPPLPFRPPGISIFDNEIYRLTDHLDPLNIYDCSLTLWGTLFPSPEARNDAHVLLLEDYGDHRPTVTRFIESFE